MAQEVVSRLSLNHGIGPLMLGLSLGDEFKCSRCTAKGITGDESDNGTSSRHTYTHALVRCTKGRPNVAEAAKPSTEERLTMLEQKVVDVGVKLDRLGSQLGDRLLKMEQTLESVQQAMNVVLSRYPPH